MFFFSSPIRVSRRFFAAAAALIAGTLTARGMQGEQHLAIVQAGVQAEEDGPFVTSEHQFERGGFLYFVCQVSWFAVRSTGESKGISLTYVVTPRNEQGLPLTVVTPRNEQGLPLTPSETGKIEAELNPEDKNWMPKRRVSFPLPSFVAAGAFNLHLAIQDDFGKSEATEDFPFRIGGVRIRPSASLNVQNFHFFRSEDMRAPLEIPAYRPGDPIYAGFDIAGFELGPENRYRLSYDLLVLRPDGKPFLKQGNAAQLDDKSFYPATFVPAAFNVITNAQTDRGEYVLLVTLHDLTAGLQAEFRTAFSIE